MRASMMRLRRYDLFRRDRAVKGKGSEVLLYTKNALGGRQVEWKNEFPEQVWCKIKCQNRELYISVVTVNRSETETSVLLPPSVIVTAMF